MLPDSPIIVFFKHFQNLTSAESYYQHFKAKPPLDKETSFTGIWDNTTSAIIKQIHHFQLVDIIKYATTSYDYFTKFASLFPLFSVGQIIILLQESLEHYCDQIIFLQKDQINDCIKIVEYAPKSKNHWCKSYRNSLQTTYERLLGALDQDFPELPLVESSITSPSKPLIAVPSEGSVSLEEKPNFDVAHSPKRFAEVQIHSPSKRRALLVSKETISPTKMTSLADKIRKESPDKKGIIENNDISNYRLN